MLNVGAVFSGESYAAEKGQKQIIQIRDDL